MSGGVSHGEQVGEEVGEHGQGDEPEPDPGQYPATPPLDGRRLCSYPLDGALLGAGHGECRSEEQPDQDDGGSDECGEGRPETAEGEGVAGQTGQDGTRSAEPGQNIGKPEQCEPAERTVTPQPGLASENWFDQSADAVH